jgi:hypothetical protein
MSTEGPSATTRRTAAGPGGIGDWKLEAEHLARSIAEQRERQRVADQHTQQRAQLTVVGAAPLHERPHHRRDRAHDGGEEDANPVERLVATAIDRRVELSGNAQHGLAEPHHDRAPHRPDDLANHVTPTSSLVTITRIASSQYTKAKRNNTARQICSGAECVSAFSEGTNGACMGHDPFIGPPRPHPSHSQQCLMLPQRDAAWLPSSRLRSPT